MKRHVPVLLSLLALAAGPGFSDTASLVRDFNTDSETGEYPSELRAAGGKVFFLVKGPTEEVWVSDGTPAGTLLLWACEDFCQPRLMGSLGGTILWAAEEPGENLQRLWRSDGTRPGTFPILGPEQGAQLIVNEIPSPNWAVFRGHLWFSACRDGHCSLWQTDGTLEGTVSDVDIPPSGPVQMVVTGSHLYFRTDTPGNQDLWATDGTPGNAMKVAELSGIYPGPETVAAGDRLFFVAPADGLEVWTSDGTPAGTRPVSRFTANEAISSPLKAVGSRVYFLANEPPEGLEVWVSNGTASGTRRVTRFGTERPTSILEEAGGRLVILVREAAQLRLWTTDGRPESTAPLPPPEPCSDCRSLFSFETKLIRAGSRIVFVGRTPEHGAELWSTDGRQGPRLVKDICPGPCTGFNQPPFPWPGGLLLSAGSDSSGKDLWFSDGTSQGTRRLTAVPRPGLAVLVGETGAAALGSTLLFGASAPPGTGLWASEGPESTRLVMAVGSTAATSYPGHLTALGDRLFLTACQNGTRLLWSTRGTPDSTLAAEGFKGEESSCGDLPRRSEILGAGPGFVLAHNQDPFHPELWRSDGTPAGTFLLVEGFRPSEHPSSAVLNNRLFFPGVRSGPLWVSDGTVAGTEPFLDDIGDDIQDLTAVGNRLYFTVRNPDRDEVWISDGTAAGTRPLVELQSSFFEPALFTLFGSYVFFAGPDSRLWYTDGTPGGTLPLGEPNQLGVLSELTVFQGALYFVTSGHRLWRTDGTVQGTLLLHTFDVDLSFVAERQPSDLTVIGGRLVFVARDEAGLELWTSDGTAAGTRRLRDIAPGPVSSSPSGLTVGGGRVFFVARTRTYGSELWQTDGTEAGTRLVQDLWPLAASARPERLTVAGDRLYFTADDGLRGRELWSLPLNAAAGCQPSSTRLCLNAGRFQVEAVWRDFQDRNGVGRAVPLTADTGYFWFFDPANVETVVKILDGRGLNDHFWVFYGALSNVGYSLTVTDTQTGAARRYNNPRGQFASVGDTKGFGPLGAFSTAGSTAGRAASGTPLVLAESRVDSASTTELCVASATRLCLNGDRFAVEVSWKDFQGHEGVGTAVELTSDTGYFWFFDASNVEVVLKALDGTDLNGHYWIFYGALSNVEYTLRVTDTVTGTIKTYRNPSGRFGSVGDTTAF